MPAKNPRVMVVLDKPLYRWVARRARRNGASVSMEVRNLLRDSYLHLETDTAADTWLTQQEWEALERKLRGYISRREYVEFRNPRDALSYIRKITRSR